MRLRLLVPALTSSVALVAGTAACTGGGATPPAPSTPAPSATAVAAEPVTRDVVLGGTQVALEVGPVAVHGDVAVLRLAARTDPPALRLALWEVFESISSAGPNGVRLVDTTAGTVSSTSRDAGDRPVMSRNGSPEGPRTEAAQQAAGEDVEIVYAAFAVPGGDTVDVMLPTGGWVDDVPVVDADTVPDLTVPPAELSEDEVTAPLTFPLEEYAEELGGQVRARETPEQVTVQVASDVLFAVDSDQLGPASEAALAAAGAQVAQYPGGALTIVGHTDDVADDAYNLDLSGRRAQTVAARLGQVVDLSAFDVSVEGRGESEPVAAGTSADARALNRRVEVVLVPAGAPQVAPQAEVGAVPAAEGPSAPGPEGVTYQDGEDVFTVRLPHVRRDGRYLVGELVLGHDAGPDETISGILASGADDVRGEFDPSLQAAATNVTLLHGAGRTYPLDYLRSADRQIREPLADRMLNVVPVGGTRTVTVVWPDTGAQTVTVDVAQRAAMGGQLWGGPPFRLTDVPVVED